MDIAELPLDDDAVYVLTPKGVLTANLPGASEAEIAHVMDRLYVHAMQQMQDKNQTPAIVWQDGHWQFTAVIPAKGNGPE